MQMSKWFLVLKSVASADGLLLPSITTLSYTSLKISLASLIFKIDIIIELGVEIKYANI